MTFLLLAPCLLLAQERTPDELKRLSDEAMKAAQSGQVEKAIGLWEDILDEVPAKAAADVHANLAVAYRMSKRLPAAWYHLTQYLKKAGKEDLKAGKELELLEKELAKEHVKIALVCEPEGADASFDEQLSHPCPITWWFTPGKHTAKVGKKDFEAKTVDLDVRLRGGEAAHVVKLEPVEKKNITIAAGQTLVEKPEIAPVKEEIKMPDTTVRPVVTAKPAEKPRKSFKGAQWGLLGGGLGVVVVGGILQIAGYSKNKSLHEDYPSDVSSYYVYQANQKAYQEAYDDEVKPLKVASIALYCTGGVAAAAGAIWLLADAARKPDKVRKVKLEPVLGPDMTGAAIGFGF
jgi:tetratricopeptide (TPR) repeat protein